MAFDATFAAPNTDVTTGGTITLPYPNGRTADDYADSGHLAYVYGAARTITPSFGGSDITFTWLGATIPAGTRVPIQLELAAPSTGSGSTAWADITGKPSTFTPSTHSHAISDITGLQTALDGKQTSTTALSALAALTPAANKLAYFDGSSSAALTDLTATGRTIIGLSAGTDGYVLKMVSGNPAWAAESGGGGSPGGSNTQVQFNDSSAFGGDSGFTFNKTNKSLALGGATVTSSATLAQFSQTWNGSGQAFYGVDVSITTTAYDSANSAAFRARQGTTEKWAVKPTGENWSVAEYKIAATFAGQATAIVTTGKFGLYNAGVLGWSASTNGASALDTALYRDDIGVVGLRNASSLTSPCAVNVYGTYTSATDNEYVAITAGAANHKIAARKGSGGGTLRPLIFSVHPKSGNPSTTELPNGFGGFFKDTGGSTLKVIINDGDALYGATLAAL